MVARRSCARQLLLFLPVFVNKILVVGNHSLEETKLWPLVACQQVVKPVAGQTRYEELSN